MIPDAADSNSALYKNVVNFLHRATQTLTHVSPILKSYYGCRLRVLEKRSSVFIKNKSAAMTQCPRCIMSYDEVGVNNVLKPQKELTKFAKKVLHKRANHERLTRYQAKYLETIKPSPFNFNQMISTCSFCKKESTYEVPKPARLQSSNGQVKSPNVPQITKKKKRQKKDKFCGLNTDAVLSVRKTSKQVTPQPKEKIIDKVITKKQKKKMRDNVDKLALMLTSLPEARNPGENLARFLTSR